MPQTDSTLPALLSARAAEWPDHGYVWLEDGDTQESRLNFVSLERRVFAIVAGLKARAAPGDRVLVLLPLGLDYTAAILGIAAAGMIAVPVYPPDPANQMMGLGQVKSILEDSNPAIGLTASLLAGLIRVAGEMEPTIAALDWLHLDAIEAEHAGARPDIAIAPDDIAILLYTSGSTGAPKGVMLSHANLIETARAMAEDCRLTPQASICVWIPGYHVSGLFSGIVLPLWAGATVVGFSPRAFVERPRRWLEAIDRYRVVLSGAPTFAYDVCARAIQASAVAGLDLSCWEMAVVGGEAIRPEVMDAFTARFAPAGFRSDSVYTMFGQTEAAMITTGSGRLAGMFPLRVDTERLRAGKAVAAADAASARVLLGSGRSLPGMGCRIVDADTRRTLPDGDVGEIWLAGAGVGLGYWGRKEASHETFDARTAEGEGPFLRTGDLGFLRDGHVYVVGRMKEVIILRGLKFYPDDIEATVQRAEPSLGKATVAAFAFEGADGSEQLGLAIEVSPTAEGPSQEALAGAIRRALSTEWAIQAGAIVLCAPGQLPRTRTAKVQRAQCATLLASGQWQPVGGFIGAGESRQVAADLGTLSTAELAARLPDELALLIGARLGLPPERVARDRTIAELGVDSMAIIHLSLDISARFGVQIAAEELRGDRTVTALAATILAQRTEQSVGQEVIRQNRWLRSALLAGSRLVARTEIVGRYNLPQEGPAILVANHVNTLDAPLLADMLPDCWPTLVASAHLAKRPVTDWLLRALFRPLYIDLTLALSFIQALDALRRGEFVCIAPEGKLNPDGAMSEAKPGAAFLAAMTGAPVVPVALSGHVGWKGRLLGLRPLAARIEIGKPMRFSGTGDDDLARHSQQIMLAIGRMLPPSYHGIYSSLLAGSTERTVA